MSEEYFEREAEIFSRTVKANQEEMKNRTEQIAEYMEAITNYKEAVKNLKNIKRKGSSWFGLLFNREEEAKKASKEDAEVYAEARKNVYNCLTIEDENADLIRMYLETGSKNLADTLMDNSHNQHHPTAHLVKIESLPVQEDKPSFWQITKSRFTKIIPNLFKNIFGGTDNTVKPSKDDHKQTFENVTNMTEGEQKKLDEERTQEIKNGIEATTQGKNSSIKFEVPGLKYILIFPMLNSPKQTTSSHFLQGNLRSYMF